MAPAAGDSDYLRQFAGEAEWYNEVFLSAVVPGDWWRRLPHPLRSWLRNLAGVFFLYLTCGFIWCFVIYYWKRHAFTRTARDSVPTVRAMRKQIVVSLKAMPFFAAFPTVYEYMIESGWTRCFLNISETGWAMYVIYVALYLCFLEISIYWIHRGLHDIQPLYKYLHATHHMYNKEHALSPFAGLAFNPLDGVLQGIPHLFALLLISTHFRTHIALLFIEVVWTTYIHDCIHGKIWQVVYNFGQGARLPGNFTIELDTLYTFPGSRAEGAEPSSLGGA
ncbi:unnamed protein product [Urochloa decumbens]|uniref:aldehyde oxygenase (deformylating) n=1 Tax=Urochloa decumbens TaxID=240449 RepID=A0ABC9G9F3_9POAL